MCIHTYSQTLYSEGNRGLNGTVQCLTAHPPIPHSVAGPAAVETPLVPNPRALHLSLRRGLAIIQIIIIIIIIIIVIIILLIVIILLIAIIIITTIVIMIIIMINLSHP